MVLVAPLKIKRLQLNVAAFFVPFSALSLLGPFVFLEVGAMELDRCLNRKCFEKRGEKKKEESAPPDAPSLKWI